MNNNIYKSMCLAVGSVLLVGFMSGCSSIKTYPNSHSKNITIETKTNSDSFFLDVDAYLHIYDVNKKCELDYQGTVDLDEPVVKVGVPVNKLSYLQIAFVKSGFLSSSHSSISSETVFKARKGRNYGLEASYIDNMYNVDVWEKRSRKSRKRSLEKIPLESCRTVK